MTPSVTPSVTPAVTPGEGGAGSVARRLTRTFTTFVVLLLLVGTTGVLGLVVAGGARDRQLGLDHLLDANTAMLLAMANAETGVRGYRLSQDRAFLEPYETGRTDFAEHSAAAAAAARGEDERRLVRAQVAVAEQWFTDYAAPVAAMAPGRVVVSEELTVANKRTFDDYRSVNSQLDTTTTRREQAALALERAMRGGALAVSALALALALAVARTAHRRTRRDLEEPLSAVVTVLGHLGAGRDAARAEADRGPEEVRVLARSVNALADESDRLRRERAAAARAQRLALEVGRSIRDHLVAGDLVADATSRLGEGLAVDRVYVRLLEGEDFGAVEHEWAGGGLPPLPPAASAELGEDVSARRARELYARGEPWVVEDLAAVVGLDPQVDSFAARTGASAALIVPIGAGDRALGLLCLLVHGRPRPWSDHDAATASSVAADLGRALVIAGLLRQQEHLVEQLRDLDTAKTNFLSAVSHELRTPLTSIAGYVEMVRDGDGGQLPPGADAMLAVVDRNTTRLQGLIEDLLTLSRIESGTFRVSRADVVVTDVLALAVECIRPAADSGGVALHAAGVDSSDAEAEGVVVHADPVQVERALLNLVSNAVKFTPPGGRVDVSVRAEGDWVVVEVADTGIGIPAAEQDALFSRFFRASNATALAIPGTGLGLMIVRTVVELHGGELQVRSVEGEGTTVSVRLPVVAATAAAARPQGVGAP